MYKVLGILPARGGSKGLPGKNLLEIAGRSLVEWSASALVDCPRVDTAICSTDSPQIAEVAAKAGLQIPFIRPAELSSDSTPVRLTIVHALEHFRKNAGEVFELVALVQATSPTVTPGDVSRAISYLVENNLDTVFFAQKLPDSFHPAVTFQPSSIGEIDWVIDHRIASKRRQEWGQYFARTGIVYIFRSEHILEGEGLYSGRTGFLEVETKRAIVIDTLDDYEVAKKLLENESRIQ